MASDDKELKYYVGQDFGSFDNPCHQSHFSTFGLCGMQFDLKYINGFPEEIRRLNTEIGTVDHQGIESYHCKWYLSPNSPIDHVVNGIVAYKNDKTQEEKYERARQVFDGELERRLTDPSKAPIKQVQNDPKKAIKKACDDGFEMLDAYCNCNNEDLILTIDDVVMCEVDVKMKIEGIWFEGTIDQIRLAPHTIKKYGNRFTWDEFEACKNEKDFSIYCVDAKTGIMIPGYYGLINSLQLRLYSVGIQCGTILINNNSRCLGIYPEKGFIYHTRKLQRHKRNYTNPKTKQKFKPGDLKGDPIITVFNSEKELVDSFSRFKKIITSIYNGIKLGVYIPNIYVCDSFCNVAETCTTFSGKHIEDDVIKAAQEVAETMEL